MFRSFALICLVSLSVTPVFAQPDAPPEPVAPTQQIEDVVRSFVDNLNGSNVYLAAVDKVAGVRDYGYAGKPQWSEAWAKRRGNVQLEVEKIEVSDLTATTAKARVSYFWKNYEPHFRTQTIVETLRLQSSAPPNTGNKSRWQITVPPVPKTPEEARALMVEMGIEPLRVAPNGLVIVPDNFPVLNEAARKIADPKAASEQESEQQSLSNLKRLAMAALSFSMDTNQKYAFKAEFYKEAISPYLEEQTTSIIPATGEPYTFNGHLNGLSSVATNLPHANRFVMFYEGENETPEFRYNGRAAIAFADGHVSPDEAKKLIWKP